jgi:hypothetical protein
VIEQVGAANASDDGDSLWPFGSSCAQLSADTQRSVERLMGAKAEGRFDFIQERAEFASTEMLDVGRGAVAVACRRDAGRRPDVAPSISNVPEPLLLLPFFLVSIGGNAMTAMASIADRLLHCGE